MNISRLSLLLAFALACPLLAAEPTGPITEYLVLPRVGEYGKAPVHRDPIDAAIAAGAWRPPAAGEEVTAADGSTVAWSQQKTPASGALNDRKLAGGYAYATINSPDERVVLLQATRHASARVNDAWLAGDPGGNGFVETPVLLRPGANELLLHVARPGMQAELASPGEDFLLRTTDAVLPDLVRGETDPQWASVVLINASREPLVGGEIAAKIGAGNAQITRVPRIEPLSVQRVAFRVQAEAIDGVDQVEVRVELVKRGLNATPASVTDPGVSETPNDDLPQTADKLAVLTAATVTLRIVEPSELVVRTFRSRIDASVQKYAVLPASEAAREATTGIVLSLHDFGVDCRQHAAQHSVKPWAHVVAPQGRRRFGFDWEDWDATDAFEALDAARVKYASNPRRTYLTGVGVGGHGAWLLGARMPHRFAAVGPSGGWLSYWSLGKMAALENPTPVEAMLARAASPSDTLAVLRNLAATSVYVLHDADDRQASQGRFARRQLGSFHTDFVYYERPESAKRDAGIEWPGMSLFFRQRESPEQGAVTRVDFTTTDPGQSSRCHWASIEAQNNPLLASRIVLQHDPKRMTFTGRTENVARLALDVSHLPSEPRGKIGIRLDGSAKITAPRPTSQRGGTRALIWLAKEEATGRWQRVPGAGDGAKTARRQGGFKSVFNHNAVLVYGTNGTDEENRWAAAKARYDAQTFWVRSGGSLTVLPDTEFDPFANPNRNVVLYGNADTNRAWAGLLSSSPVQVRKGQTYVGVRPEADDSLGVLMVRPRRGSRTAVVGVVGGTGLAGMRLTNRLRYFVAGVAYPDLLLIGEHAPTEGAAGVRAVGSFGHDWSLEKGDVAWRDLAL